MNAGPEKREADVTQLLAALDRGEADAFHDLIEVVYPELKRLAHFQLGHERQGHTMSTTAIVHEAFLRLSPTDGGWKDRGHFFRTASRIMRHVLIDHARRRRAQKRGGDPRQQTLNDNMRADDDDTALLAIDDAIRDLAEIHPRLEQVMECRFFAGLSVAETAEALGISSRTVELDWSRARTYLLQALESGPA